MRDVFVFLGHDFFGREKDRRVAYREAVAKGCELANQDSDVQSQGIRFTILYADSSPTAIGSLWRRARAHGRFRYDGRYWMKIRALIAECDYTLFDLSYRDGTAPFNSNVLLEFGLGIGLKKRTRSFGNSRANFTRLLSNQAGYDFPEYNSLDELQLVIEELLLQYLDTIPQ